METISCNNQTDVNIKIPQLVGSKKNQETTIVKVNGVQIGGAKVIIIAGPCAVESMEQLFATA
jgi:3-deoxy-7-phosphoheptulonate synthase